MTSVRAVTGAFTVLTVLTVLVMLLSAARAVALPVGSLAWLIGSVIVGLISAALAVVVSTKAPHNWCAAPLALAGWWLCSSASSESLLTGAPANPWLVALTQGSWMLYYLPLAWLLLIFPTGRVLTPRWRVVAVALPVVVVCFNLASALAPGPFADPYADSPKLLGSHPAAAYIAVALLPVYLGLLVASVVSLFRRYRRGSVQERRQLRWMAVAGLSIPLTLLLCWLSFFLIGGADLVVVGLATMYLAVPAATAIAIVRSTLFDVDRLVVRGTVYAALGAVLLALLGVVSAAAGWWAGRGSAVPAVAVTAVVLVAMLPLRRRAERLVASWLFPRREQLLRSLERLRHDVHAGIRPPEALEGCLREAVADPTLRVGYRLPGRPDYVDSAGQLVEPDASVTEVRMGGDQIAIINQGDTLAWSVEITGAIGYLSELVRLRLETAHALQEVEASRRRLVAAHDEERHRLERDLHDGAQQRLVTLGMALRRTQRHLPEQERELAATLDGAVHELQAAVRELRQIAHGLRPSSLDDGLSAALDSLRSRAGVPLHIEVDTGALPEPISTTAYFVASEAVTNAIKYASARTISLSVRPSTVGVVVQICDDGRGGAVLRHGSGLAGLRDRVRALGGDLSVVSPVDRGTVVEAVLPCGS